MSSKISSLVAATDMDAADVTVIVHAGADKKATRDALLTAVAGQPILMQGNGATVEIDAVGAVLLLAPFTAGVSMSQFGSGDTVQVSAGGGVDMHSVANHVSLISGTTSITLDAAVNAIRLLCGIGGVVDIEYHAGTPANWAGAPLKIWQAIDRIAAVVRVLNGAPIP